MSEKYKQTLAEIFDAHAINYDEDHLRARLGNRLVEIAEPQPGERVLDIATGIGLVAIPTARKVVEGGRVVGVALSKGMRDRASKDVEAEGLGRLSTRRPGSRILSPRRSAGWSVSGPGSARRKLLEAARGDA